MIVDEMRGDFIGFYYNGKHSSSLNIIRTSDGSRYNENLLPNFNDKTSQIIGRNETYYFGSDYTQKQIDINFAFDNLTIEKLHDLKRWLSNKNPSRLFFDEDTIYGEYTQCSNNESFDNSYTYFIKNTDGFFIKQKKLTAEKYNSTTDKTIYWHGDDELDNIYGGKYYWAKISGQPNMKYLAFDEERRTYKGEGTISFIAYYPFKIEYPAITGTISSNYCFDINNNSGDIDIDWELCIKAEESGTYILHPVHNNDDTFYIYDNDIDHEFKQLITKGVQEQINVYYIDQGSPIRINPNTILQPNVEYYYGRETSGEPDIQFTTTNIYIKQSSCIPKFNLGIDEGTLLPDKQLVVSSNITLINGDVYILVNTKTNLLEGLNSSMKRTGNIYNQYLTSGNFFMIPPNTTKTLRLEFDSSIHQSLYNNCDYKYERIYY